MHPKLALYGSTTLCARTDTVFFPIYQVCSRAGTLVDHPVNCEVPEYTGVQATSLQRKLNENVKITAKEHIAMKHMDQ